VSPPDRLSVLPLAAVIDFGGSLLLVGYLVAAVRTAWRAGPVAARHAVADGAVTALGFKAAGTLLKTIELRTWEQILAFVAVLALRTILKRVFAAEQVRTTRSPTSARPAPSPGPSCP
jgi:hypothetical protein